MHPFPKGDPDDENDFFRTYEAPSVRRPAWHEKGQNQLNLGWYKRSRDEPSHWSMIE